MRKHKWVILAALSCQGWVRALAPEGLPLLQPTDMRYLGSFAVPSGDGMGCNGGTGEHCFTYGGVFGFNPATPSLLMKGHAWAGGVGEVTIPETLGNQSEAEVVQNIQDISDGIPVDPGETNGQGPSAMLSYNGRWIISGSTYYDADYTQVVTHGVSGTDLSLPSDFQGWFRFDPGVKANPRSIGGYMTTIPQEWREALGGPALTGHCCLSIISASSSGPSVTVFDPDHVGVQDPIPGTTLLYYPTDKPLAPNNTQNPLFNLATKMSGVAFPAGSRSVLFFGHQGTGPYCYGEGSECDDPCDDSKGTHAAPYRHQVWAYDAVELLKVKAGESEPWEIKPYAVWPLEEMDSGGCAKMSGASYDAATGRMYITETFSDHPAVHVYQVSVSTASTREYKRPETMAGRNSGRVRVSVTAIGKSFRIDAYLPEFAPARVRGEIRDLGGILVTKLSLERVSSSGFSATWDGLGTEERVPSGTYVFSLDAGDGFRQAKVFHAAF